jgi:hypothetical protein
MVKEEQSQMKALEVLGGKPRGRRLSIYVPSKDKEGGSIDHTRWMDQAMSFLTKTFGRCTAMPRLEGIWSDPASGCTLRETTNVVFSFVKEEDFEQRAEQVREFLIEMGQITSQAEVGFEYDGVFYTIEVKEGNSSGAAKG